jgi:UDP-N-acetyl-D-mannosaminuronic acid transferase (WecB/TagA/CpsF family)
VSKRSYHTILGVTYFNGSVEAVVKAGSSAGLVVVPSAPVIVRMQEDTAHRESILNADLAVIDSGLMVLCWRFLTGERLVRVSGLAYLQALLGDPAFRALDDVAWIMPGAVALDTNLHWLQQAGHRTTREDCYVAPQYASAGPLEDLELLNWVKARKPSHLIIALGGGVQERLGWYLKREGGHKMGIHCIGAAIGFISGEQTHIPVWADRFYLGWLFRSLFEPRRFIPRYFKAARLIRLLARYKHRLPPLLSH